MPPSPTHHCCELVEVGAQVAASQVDVGALIAHLVAAGGKGHLGTSKHGPPRGTLRLGDPQGQGHLGTWRHSSIKGQKSSGATGERDPWGHQGLGTKEMPGDSNTPHRDAET